MTSWSGPMWLASVLAVVVSGAVAAAEGNWRRRPGLHLGFATHGGMWGDLVLLPIVNAAIAPWITPGVWLGLPFAMALFASIAAHRWWHGGHLESVRDHMWPSRPTGRWHRDLSWAGWCHVGYVALELTLLLAYAATPTPPAVVLLVSTILTVHVLIGVLQPSWAALRRLTRDDAVLATSAIAAPWLVAGVKVLGAWGLGA